jgi:hypothetical protein
MSIDGMTYRNEIRDLATEAVQESREQERDVQDIIHEVVDGHQWIIYYSYNLSVLQHTDHCDAAAEIGGLEDILRSRGVQGLMSYLACAAMIEDVSAYAYRLEAEEA